MSLKLEIQNFRNIGVGTKEPAYLLLDRNLDQVSKIGDLVILVGPNNHGKSSVLDALYKLGQNSKEWYIETTDVPYFLDKFNESDHVKLSLKDTFRWCISELTWRSDMLEDEFKKIKNNIERLLSDEFVNNAQIDTKDFYFRNFKYIDSEEKNIFWTIRELFDEIRSLIDGELLIKNLFKLNRIFQSIDWNENNKVNDLRKGQINPNYKNPNIQGLSYNNIQTQNKSDKNKLNKSVFDKFGNETAFANLFIKSNKFNSYCKIVKDIKELLEKSLQTLRRGYTKYIYFDTPAIYKYKDTDFSTSDFTCNFNDANSNLFNNILQYYNIKHSELTLEKFKQARDYWNEKLNEKRDELSNAFNNLFKEKDYQYRFSIHVDISGLSFEINKINNKNTKEKQQKIIPAPYNQQSTGFKWFFNLYFNLLINAEQIKPGDIILIDEPATNICMTGVVQLREMLKMFAVEHQITLVITTHNSYWVDCDYLEELRILDKKDGNIKIYNNFNYDEINYHGSNTLLATLEALKCFPNLLTKCKCSPKYIFVEGITDYLYLTAIKQYVLKNCNFNDDPRKRKSYERLIFIPINGAGKNDKEAENIYKEICNEYEYNYGMFLVDGDEPGLRLKKQEDDKKIPIQTLPDLLNDKDMKEMENLISKKDLDNFKLLEFDKGGKKLPKNTDRVYKFKRNLIFNDNDKSISKTTISNLTKLLNALAD